MRFCCFLFLIFSGLVFAQEANDVFIQKATTFLEGQQARVLEKGMPLTKRQMELAAKVGVKEPEKVRVLVVSAMPLPKDQELNASFNQMGVDISRASGMTMGHGIIVMSNVRSSDVIMIHELKHVAQYEEAGGIQPFLKVYFEQVKKHGYRNAPLEAAAFEAMKLVTR